VTGGTGEQTTNNPEYLLQILELADRASSIQNLDEIGGRLLPGVVSATGSSGAILYIDDSALHKSRLFQYGCPEQSVAPLEKICSRQLESFTGPALPGSAPVIINSEVENISSLVVYQLPSSGTFRGLIAFLSLPGNNLGPPQIAGKLLQIISNSVARCIDIAKYRQQIIHLNVYMSVSNLLSQSTGLHELLETILYCCMDVVTAEAASVLLLDDEKKSFHFYQVEGPAKPILMKSIFPADNGIAGAVLQSQQSEIINDVQNDPRFYRDLDSQSGFQTRNMIVLPLNAGEERIGVLEVLNKIDGGTFLEPERMILASIADEISFGIRNAKIFEYVANSYCKQRQGQNSCKGCQRPLGSWTPCVKYRETDV
jgi:GAF domain-containing protein